MKVLVCKTVIEPREVPVGSKSQDNKIWQVIPTTIFNDAICECPGYVFRGRCSHIDQVEADHCFWHSADIDLNIDRCPNCNSELIIYELETEYPNAKS